ncbi:MAG: site-2 protease family protein [Actinobacteria bacterium]|nr:MAG: site-2 protease family protein [Actinomycetota bacterium]
MFGRNAWSIGRLGGVELKIDPSWSFIAFLIGYSFFVVLDFRFDAIGTGVLIGLAGLMALAFFFCVLLHELAHAWVAQTRDVEVESITLFLFGGATKADLETEEPNDELTIAIVGPVTSLVLAGLFWLGAVGFGSGTVGGFVSGRLGWINLILAVFNLVPGFPLDGGRVLRSIIWKQTGNIARATRIAARAGQVVGFSIIALGALEILLLGALIGGLWMVAIGWFLAQAAQASFLQLQFRQILAEVPASRVMSNGVVEIAGDVTIQRAVDEYFMKHDHNAFPVRDGDQTVALLTLNAVRETPREQWSTTRVSEIAEPLSDSLIVAPSDHLDEVVGKLMGGDLRRVVVATDGEVSGVITPRDLSRWMQRTQELGLTESHAY